MFLALILTKKLQNQKGQDPTGNGSTTLLQTDEELFVSTVKP
jgi:hypothetical protein